MLGEYTENGIINDVNENGLLSGKAYLGHCVQLSNRSLHIMLEIRTPQHAEMLVGF